MQYLDPGLLRTRLSESLWYLHSQPPLFNLLLGVGLKLFPACWPKAFAVLWGAMAGGLCWAVYLLQRRLGVVRSVALIVTVVLAVSPGLALYSNWLFYSLPTALLLALAAFSIAEFGRSGRQRYATLAFGALAGAGMIHALFHPLLVVGMAVLTAWLMPGRRRAVAVAVAVPVLLLGGLSVKNLVVFGRFTASTWTGMNLWATTGVFVPDSVRQRFVCEGRMTRAALIDRFEAIEQYPDSWLGNPPALVPALVQRRRSSGYPNFNHYGYIAVSDRYRHDALVAISQWPLGFVKGLLKSWFCYFKSPTDYVLLEPNRSRIEPVNRIFDVVLGGRLPFDFKRLGILPVRSERGQHIGLLLVFGLPLVVANALVMMKRRQLVGGQRLAAVWACGLIIWVALAGNLMEAGENHRFRFATDPLTFALLGLLVTRLSAVKRRCRLNRKTAAGQQSPG